mgnify:CR=1 FL=1
MDIDKIVKANTEYIGKKVVYFKEIDSTKILYCFDCLQISLNKSILLPVCFVNIELVTFHEQPHSRNLQKKTLHVSIQCLNNLAFF